MQNIYDTLTSPQSLVSVVYADVGRSVPRRTERERERERERVGGQRGRFLEQQPSNLTIKRHVEA